MAVAHVPLHCPHLSIRWEEQTGEQTRGLSWELSFLSFREFREFRELPQGASESTARHPLDHVETSTGGAVLPQRGMGPRHCENGVRTTTNGGFFCQTDRRGVVSLSSVVVV